MAWDKYTAELRTQKAIEMRGMGVDYDYIAQELGYADRSGAWRAVNRGMKRVTYEKVSTYREMALIELDIMAEKLWPAVTAGNFWAINKSLQISEKRLRLVGAYDKCKCKMDSESFIA